MSPTVIQILIVLTTVVASATIIYVTYRYMYRNFHFISLNVEKMKKVNWLDKTTSIRRFYLLRMAAGEQLKVHTYGMYSPIGPVFIRFNQKGNVYLFLPDEKRKGYYKRYKQTQSSHLFDEIHEHSNGWEENTALWLRGYCNKFKDNLVVSNFSQHEVIKTMIR